VAAWTTVAGEAFCPDRRDSQSLGPPDTKASVGRAEEALRRVPPVVAWTRVAGEVFFPDRRDSQSLGPPYENLFDEPSAE
jgi:hypothetical protein